MNDTLIRFALKLDAVVTGATGTAYLAGAGILDSPLGLPAGMLRAIGAFLLVFALAVWMIGSRPGLRPALITAVVAANVAWVAESLALVAFDWFSPATAGVVWVVLQAIVVGAFAALQATAMRRVASPG